MIKPGDTLSAIAKKYGVGISDIMKLNAITNPNKIQAGKLIKIK
jgi:LysM repeat protein